MAMAMLLHTINQAAVHSVFITNPELYLHTIEITK